MSRVFTAIAAAFFAMAAAFFAMAAVLAIILLFNSQTALSVPLVLK